jgi:choline dehydrogenase-like flavoprotein
LVDDPGRLLKIIAPTQERSESRRVAIRGYGREAALLDQGGEQLPTVTADLCIIGGGPAGLILARELIGTGLSLCLVESGAAVPSPDSEALAKGAVEGEEIHPPEETTRRAFGGAAHAWDIRTGLPGNRVRHMRMDGVDFEPQPWLPLPGWPFGAEELAPYYPQAEALCGLLPFGDDPAPWEEPPARRLPLDPAAFETAMCQFGAADLFHTVYPAELRRAERDGALRLLLQTTVRRLLPAPEGGAIGQVLCARLDGSRFTIAARCFVLAAGGVQNARLLLLSQPGIPGLGGAMAGRGYHDHPLIFGGLLTPGDPGLFAAAALYDIRGVREVPAMGYLNLTTALRREAGLSGVATFLFPRPEPRATHALEALRDGLGALRGTRRMPIGPATVARLFARRPGTVLRGALEAARGRPVLAGFKEGGWSRQPAPGGGWRSFHLWHQVEQSADPANGVMLGEARDRFGDPLPVLHWRWGAADDTRVARAQDLLARAIEAAGLGRFDILRQGGRTALAFPAGAHHVLGTTRMADDPRHGVVDADGRVHGMSNLHVAGGSIFPTGGAANPTLTIVALALRQARYLREALRRTARPIEARAPLARLAETGTGLAGQS